MSAANAALRAQQERLLAWWQQRNSRERLMIALVGLCAILAVADALVWQPMQRERRQLLARIDAAEQASAKLAARAALEGGSPQALAARARTATAEIGRIDEQIESLRRRVVTPPRMAERMREFVASARGLTVLSLRNLPPQPVTGSREAAHAGGDAGKPGEAPAGTRAPEPSTAGPNDGRARSAGKGLYRHPLEVRVAGGYADIAQWVAFIEGEAEGFYLSALQLESASSGRIEARIELFTLGTEATWLTL